MATRVETDMSQFEALVNRPTLHYWPTRAPYRKSGAAEPQPGDIALCGTVKVHSPSRTVRGLVDCGQCARLMEAGL